jgi:uroporphyrinogen-III synthase
VNAASASPLHGIRVLVTRAAEDAGPLEEQLAARGAVAVAFPCIAFADPDDLEPLDAELRALRGPAAPRWVALSSPQAVRRFVGRLERLGFAPAEWLRGTSLAAVGRSTARALESCGLAAAALPELGAGAGALAATLAPLVRGEGVLLPRAEQGSPVLEDALSAAGARVRTAVLYRTGVAPAADPVGLSALRERRVGGILFASGSAARGFAALLGIEAPGLAAAAKVACMGARCAAEARANTLRVDAVGEGGLPELLDALAKALG